MANSADPLELVTTYGVAVNPKTLHKILSAEPAVSQMYADYVRDRDALDRKFWHQVRSIAEPSRGMLAGKIQHDPAFEEVKKIHASVEALGKL